MIRRLTVRFTCVAMLSLFAVLSMIIGVSTAINYMRIIDEADETLYLLTRDDGNYTDNAFADAISDYLEEKEDAGQGGRLPFTAETPFEARFFYVDLEADGTLAAVHLDRIAAIDANTAEDCALTVLQSGKTSGFYRDYRFLVQNLDGQTRITFLDCSRSLFSCRNFYRTSIFVSFLGMAAVLLLILLFSRRFVRPVAESYEKQKQFITDAGHEIKTPLAIINADADVLELEAGSENEWISDIKKQTKRLAGLTDDLISLSRMEEIRDPLHPVTVEFSAVTEETVQSFLAMAIAQKKDFKTEIAPNLLVNGDERTLRRLLSILLDNACKYCPEGGTIHLILDRHGRNLRLRLTNTAESVSPEELPRLFDRFYRTDRSRNSATGGYGIGLSIAGTIVASHHGKIQATTADGKSLTMTVFLPIKTESR